MPQRKFSVHEAQAEFLSKYKAYGFKDKSSMVRKAIDQLQSRLELDTLRESAELYSEIYTEDDNLKELTQSAITGWPE
ncbi:MAG: hypothetical protein K8S15_06750 [Candidatus Aegiribacteria sp.]|nr:hypothetical protein [Candidatus Aegiribacteria sp.]